MRVHVLKTWTEPWRATVNGEKRHEYRENDRDFQLGDFLVLRHWDHLGDTWLPGWTIRTVTYITRGPDFGIPVNFAVMSIEATPYPERVKVLDHLQAEGRYPFGMD